jgi:REP element-mobilizing transposase RayT
MSHKYKFFDKEDLYFVTFTVVKWVDVFTRIEYRDILLDSWKYCHQNKGMQIHAWCIMTNHVHMIISSNKEELSAIMRDMKSFTSTSLRKAINDNPNESRKDWMLKIFTDAGMKNNNNIDFQLWQQHNHPILLDSNYLMQQKLDYIHQNPVKSGIVENEKDYIYSSARDYCDMPGLIKIDFIE